MEMRLWLILCGLALSSLVCSGDALMSIQREGARVRIGFSGWLQSAPSPVGPWSPVVNATNLWWEEVLGGPKFYRAVMAPPPSIFASSSVVNLLVSGPLQPHFDLAFAGTPDGIFPPVREKPYFDASLRLANLELPVSMRVRGNSSLQECPFPKLKFKVSPERRAGTPFFDAREVKIGTHCAEGGHGNIGRLRDERAAYREALVYELMGIMGFVTPRVRRAQVQYRDTGTNTTSGWTITRQAFLLDDIEVVAQRLGGRALTPEEIAVLPNPSFDAEQIAELELFQALVGNWDFALSLGGQGLWNVDVVKLPNDQLLLVTGDFDLASLVTGEVRLSVPRDYRLDLGDVEREVLYRIEQLYGRTDPSLMADAKARFVEQRLALETLIESASLDQEGRENARRHLAAFYDALNALRR
jgi:hypothetical protein